VKFSFSSWGSKNRNWIYSYFSFLDDGACVLFTIAAFCYCYYLWQLLLLVCLLLMMLLLLLSVNDCTHCCCSGSYVYRNKITRGNSI